MANTITNREFFNAVIANTITEDVIAHAEAELAKMDARNAKRSATPSKAQIANEAVKAQILGVLTDEPQTASEIAVKCEISTQKASSLLARMDGLNVTDVKVKGKGKVKGYSL